MELTLNKITMTDTSFQLTDLEAWAYARLVADALAGNGSERPVDWWSSGDFYTWCSPDSLTNFGAKKQQAAGLISSLMEKGLVDDAGDGQLAINTNGSVWAELMWDDLLSPLTGKNCPKEPKKAPAKADDGEPELPANLKRKAKAEAKPEPVATKKARKPVVEDKPVKAAKPKKGAKVTEDVAKSEAVFINAFLKAARKRRDTGRKPYAGDYEVLTGMGEKAQPRELVGEERFPKSGAALDAFNAIKNGAGAAHTQVAGDLRDFKGMFIVPAGKGLYRYVPRAQMPEEVERLLNAYVRTGAPEA